MKRNISILLLILILLNTSGFSLMFGLLYYSCKLENENPGAMLETGKQKLVLTVKKSGLADIVRVNDREIKYKGKMYDVIKEEVRGEVHYIYCVWDKQEDRIVSAYNNFHQSNKAETPYTNDASKLILKNLIKNFIIPSKFAGLQQSSYKNNFAELSNYYQSVIPDIQFPPPKNIVV